MNTGIGRVLKNEHSKGNLTKKRPGDAGLDIKSAEDCVIPARGRRLVKTSLKLAVPPGHVGLLYSRSGLATDHGIEVGAGCIDSPYRGEIGVLLHNFSDEDYPVVKGDRIAQLLTIPVNLGLYREVEDLDETDRGDWGFGSSGK